MTHIMYMEILGFPGVSVLKNLSANIRYMIQSMGQEDPLEKEMSTHSVFLPGEFHEQRRLVGYSSWSCRVGHDWVSNTLLQYENIIQNGFKKQITYYFFLWYNKAPFFSDMIWTMLWNYRIGNKRKWIPL